MLVGVGEEGMDAMQPSMCSGAESKKLSEKDNSEARKTSPFSAWRQLCWLLSLGLRIYSSPGSPPRTLQDANGK